jgi:hypothetical protein
MQNTDESIDDGHSTHDSPSNQDSFPPSPIPAYKKPKLEVIEEDAAIEEPAGWSMSLTSTGLSIQAVTRNFTEFNEFTKNIAQQLIRDFGADYLPTLWDPDAEGYFEESEDDDLDEDEYLVTLPIFSTSSLLFNRTPNLHVLPEAPSRDVIRTLLNGTDTLCTLITSHFVHMLKHLDLRYQSLDANTTSTPHHLVILMLQLKLYLPNYSPQTSIQSDPLVQICILTAYVVSVTLLEPIPNLMSPPLPTSLWHNCAEYATMLLVDLLLSKGNQLPAYPVILCSVLLAWIDAELSTTEFKADTLVHFALHVLCGSQWQLEEPAWQILIAALLYLDIYSATFRFRRPQLRGEGSVQLWRAAVTMRDPQRWDASFREAGIVLEAKLMSLLSKVVLLFYEVDEDRSPHQQEHEINVRKIDVDDVLTLVRDVELWEQELPHWAKWSTDTESNRLGLKMHMHMIHNMVKILLFRPFSTEFTNPQTSDSVQADEQTYTRTTFLDMSTHSADRLVSCLDSIHGYGYTGFWTRAAGNLVRDVSKRVRQMFGSDEEIVNQLNAIKKRLEQAEASLEAINLKIKLDSN